MTTGQAINGICMVGSTSSYLHEKYADGYRGLASGCKNVGTLFSKMGACTARPVKRMRNFVHGGVSLVGSAASCSFAKLCHLKNKILKGSPQKQDTTIKSTHPEVREIRKRLRKRLIRLSKECTKAYCSPVLIPSMPAKVQIDLLINKLNLVIQAEGLQLSSTGYAAQKAIKECEEILKDLNSLEGLMNRPVTGQDIERWYHSLRNSPALSFFVAATLENMGEFMGEAVGTEYIPAAYNPAYLLMDLASTYVGQPVGHVVGLAASLAATHYAFKKMPLFSLEHRRAFLQWGAVGTLLLLHQLGLNPISEGGKQFLGSVAGNLTFYSTLLLFKYAGMAICGTQEPLDEYVKKMTPSMLSYYASSYLLESMSPFPRFVNEVLSFYTSHVFYNLDAYASLVNGTCLDDVIEKPQNMERLIALNLINGMERLAADGLIQKVGEVVVESALLDGIPSLSSTSLSDKNKERFALLRPIQEIVMQNTLLKQLLIPSLGSISLGAEGDTAAARLATLFNSIPLHAIGGDRMETGLVSMKERIPYSELSLLVRQANAFFTFMQSPGTQQLLQRFLSEMTQAMRGLKIEQLDGQHPQFQGFQTVHELLLREMIHHFGLNDNVMPMINALWQQMQTGVFTEFCCDFEEIVDSHLRKIFVTSKEEEAFRSTLFLESISALFVLWTTLSIVTGEGLKGDSAP